MENLSNKEKIRRLEIVKTILIEQNYPYMCNAYKYAFGYDKKLFADIPEILLFKPKSLKLFFYDDLTNIWFQPDLYGFEQRIKVIDKTILILSKI
jgi:hypothetical protein